MQHAQRGGGHRLQGAQQPDVRQRVQALGGEVAGHTPAELASFLAAERARWRGVIERANITPD